MRHEGPRLLLSAPPLKSVIINVMAARDLLPLQILDPYFKWEKGGNTKNQERGQTISVRGFAILNRKGCLLQKDLPAPLLLKLCYSYFQNNGD